MSAIDPNLRTFRIRLNDGSEVELRYSWPALARAEDWLGLSWLRWDLVRHWHLMAVIAAGRLHANPGETPDSIAERLDPRQLATYQQIVDDAVSFAHTGKTRFERLQEAEEERKRQEGEAEAARTE